MGTVQVVSRIVFDEKILLWVALGVELDALESTLREVADEFDGAHGAWHFAVDDVRMACMTDTHYDRMRIVAPIVEVRTVDAGHMYAMLEANYHTALDVRYAISDAVVMAAFIHPLGALSADELRAAVRQVASAVRTFGDQYSSGELMFGPVSGSAGGELN